MTEQSGQFRDVQIQQWYCVRVILRYTHFENFPSSVEHFRNGTHCCRSSSCGSFVAEMHLQPGKTASIGNARKSVSPKDLVAYGKSVSELLTPRRNLKRNEARICSL